MRTKECPECKSDIYSHQRVCYRCGYDFKTQKVVPGLMVHVEKIARKNFEEQKGVFANLKKENLQLKKQLARIKEQNETDVVIMSPDEFLEAIESLKQTMNIKIVNKKDAVDG